MSRLVAIASLKRRIATLRAREGRLAQLAAGAKARREKATRMLAVLIDEEIAATEERMRVCAIVAVAAIAHVKEKEQAP